jgi:signal transduction histidine kinase
MAKVKVSYKKSLFYRYFAICSGVILASIILMGALTIGFSLNYFKRTSQTSLKKNAEQAVSVTLSSMAEYDYKKISTKLALGGYNIISSTTGYTIFLTDTAGRTLLCTEGEYCAHKAYMVPDDVVQQAAAGEYNSLGNLGGIYKSSHYTVGLPVEHDGTVLAIVFASWDASGLWYYVMDLIDIIIFCALIATLVSSVAIYYDTNKLTSPLRSMAAAAKSFSGGDFTVRVPVEGEDEVAQLAVSFNHMADSLADLESVRRSFIANVSHELKTPMMTIGGFIDGILDGTVPEEKRSQYLVTVSEEVKRLSRMVTSMLSIARIEAGDMKISPTNFDINEMICRTVFTFEQKIEQRRLEVIGLESDEVFVFADKDLIHHVVYNLIDNAVKFANEGGCLTFKYKTEEGKVFVSVRNSGEGIPQSELPRLFDRFYKTDKSRSLDKTGVGLGLYIVQTIINQHKSDLIVSSVEGEYTEFTFSIPASDPKFIKELNKHHGKETEA